MMDTFPITREPRLSLEGLQHFLLKRIQGLDYESLMFMPIEKRDTFFQDEYTLYEKEIAQANKN